MSTKTTSVSAPGYEGLEYKLTTGSHKSATTRWFVDADGRGISVIRTYRQAKHGLIVTVKAVAGGDYRTQSYTRYFELMKTEEGWVVRSEGWDRHVGMPDEDRWVRLLSWAVRTKAEAEGMALTAARAGVALGDEVAS